MRNVLSLLATKLHRPPARHHLVPRARLLAQLDAGLRQGRRLSLVSAPAGFGKTTLVSAWVDAAGLACAWLALDADDNDPTRFLGYLIAALQQVDASIGARCCRCCDPSSRRRLRRSWRR